jgi:head-tail adaptor
MQRVPGLVLMIGRLDQRIEIQARTKAATAGGGTEMTWQAIAADPRPYAKVELTGGGEAEIATRPAARIRAKFTIRARGDVTENHRVIYDGRVWNIETLGRRTSRAGYQTLGAVSGEVSQ